jgi:putative colanic acid biosynthesis acetyltransferase WcaF
MNKRTDLNQFNNSGYHPGPLVLRVLWYITNAVFFMNPLVVGSGFKKFILRRFGAKIGTGVVIKPSVNIKYPWKLEVGDYTWIGERVWIDNLDQVKIGKHCCLSQGAYLLCGNHHYKRVAFDLMTRPITLEDGVWIGAMSTVAPGVTAKSHAILALGSVATQDLEAYTIYQGNPALPVRKRELTE